MTRSLTGGLNPGPPALKASTIPLGNRGGGEQSYHLLLIYDILSVWLMYLNCNSQSLIRHIRKGNLFE